MSRIFKASTVNIDQDNRVFIDVLPVLDDEQGIVVPDVPDEDLLENSKSPEEEVSDIIEAARAQGEQMIQQAEEKALEIIEKAKQEAENSAKAITEAAEKTGYDAGYDSGCRAAEAIRQEAEEIKAGAQAYREELIADLEPEIVNLIADISSRLLSDEVEFNPEVIMILIKQGLKHASLTGDINVHVSKEDMNTVYERKEEILATLDTMAKIEFLEDVTLKRGECIIETSFGSINCGLKSQFEGLKKSLFYLLKNR